MDLSPVALEGRHVRLEPLAEPHLDGLARVGLHRELWDFVPHRIVTPEEMLRYIQTARDEHSRGVSLPFATVDRASATVAGSTRYMNVDHAHRRVEIGSTWLGPNWQRTALNTEAKLLMLGYAFESLGCARVEFKTDALNVRSRAAILRLGAKEEATLRKHMLIWNGRWRDTVYYSILDSEWPGVKCDLERKLTSRA